MGRPPLHNTVMNLNINPADMRRVGEIVGKKGLSKFVREAVRFELDRIIPGEENSDPPFIERDGGHEQRLTMAGRAALFKVLRRKQMTLDQMQGAFGFSDPIDFLHALLGHKPLPDEAVIACLELLPKE